MFTERSPFTPSGPPRMNSVEPPPMSVTRYGAGHASAAASRVPASSRVAPVNDSHASSSPEMTSGATPRIRADPVGEFLRVHRVAGGTRRDHPYCRRSGIADQARVLADNAVIVRLSAASERRPVRSTPSPSLTMRISLRTSVSGEGAVRAGPGGTTHPFR